MVRNRTPLNVIGGYLGSGKTTLVNRLLRDTGGRRVAVLVNDFGDVDIDGALIESVDDDVISLANGCVCCSLADGLVEAFAVVHDRIDDLDRVIVEASGVAEPGTVARFGRAAGFTVGPLIVVVDAATVERRARDRYVGDTVVRQLAAADVCVVNKIDLVDAEHVERLRRWLSEVCPDARVVESVRGDIGWQLFDDIDGLDDTDRIDDVDDVDDGAPASGHTDVHRTQTFRYDEPLDRDTLVTDIGALPDSVVRVKGVVHLSDDPLRAWAVHRSGDQVELSPLSTPPPAMSRIVHISV